MIEKAFGSVSEQNNMMMSVKGINNAYMVITYKVNGSITNDKVENLISLLKDNGVDININATDKNGFTIMGKYDGGNLAISGEKSSGTISITFTQK